MALRSFKFQLRERRVRIVPLTDLSGCPFAGPGVDCIGDESDALLPLLAPLLRGLEAFEPGIQVRSLSVDLERLRLLATLEAPGRPRVVRIDNAATVERLLAPCAPLPDALDQVARQALGRRTASCTEPSAPPGHAATTSVRKAANQNGPRLRKVYEDIFEELRQGGQNTSVRCEACRALVQAEPRGETAWRIRCPCGAYDDTLRGI